MEKDFDKIQQKFYTFAEYKRFYWQTENSYIEKQELKLLTPLLEEINKGDNILEVGCGEAANIINLRKLGVDNHITASDLFDAKVEFLNNLKVDNCNFIKADVRSLPFEDETFDLVFIRDLLHHVNFHRTETIKELYRVTKKGGKVIIYEANPSTILNFGFALIFAHERGILDSTKEKLIETVTPYHYQISSLEANNIFRMLLHYSFGIPKLAKYQLLSTILDFINVVSEKFIPKNNWCYWYIKINKA